MTEVEWARLTAPDIRALAAGGRALAVLPVGALEQHGPHLPVITDSLIASELSLRAARLAAPTEPVLVLPAVWTGMSEHHLPFGGTVTLDYAGLHGVLRGVVRSLIAIGFTRLLVVNGHGGNDAPLAVACRELAVEFGFPIVAAMPWSLIPDTLAAALERQKSVHHACEAETSVMLVLAPDLVRTENLEQGGPPKALGPSPTARRCPASGALPSAPPPAACAATRAWRRRQKAKSCSPRWSRRWRTRCAIRCCGAPRTRYSRRVGGWGRRGLRRAGHPPVALPAAESLA